MSNRFVYENENELVIPSDTIDCKNCAFRNKELSNGYARAICEIYVENKPSAILFENKKCEYFKEDINEHNDKEK